MVVVLDAGSNVDVKDLGWVTCVSQSDGGGCTDNGGNVSKGKDG